MCNFIIQSTITEENQNELIGQIIDIFEDFLEDHNIDIPNKERDGDIDDPAIIYGSDYGQLQEELLELLKA